MSDEQFDVAQQLASSAAYLEYVKNTFDEAFRMACINCAREMHKLAQELAGERVGEIYDMSEEEA